MKIYSTSTNANIKTENIKINIKIHEAMIPVHKTHTFGANNERSGADVLYCNLLMRLSDAHDVDLWLGI